MERQRIVIDRDACIEIEYDDEGAATRATIITDDYEISLSSMVRCATVKMDAGQKPVVSFDVVVHKADIHYEGERLK